MGCIDCLCPGIFMNTGSCRDRCAAPKRCHGDKFNPKDDCKFCFSCYECHSDEKYDHDMKKKVGICNSTWIFHKSGKDHCRNCGQPWVCSNSRKFVDPDGTRESTIERYCYSCDAEKCK